MANDTIITVVGNLARDPELRQAGNSQVASFTIASTPRTFDRQANEWKDGETLWLACSAWRELGQNVAASLSKGMAVIAQGKLSQRSFEDNEGNRRTVVEMTVEAIGPDLRRATVQVQKNQPQGQNAPQRAPQVSGAYSAPQQGYAPQQGGYAPQGSPHGSPHGYPQPPQGPISQGGYQEEQPF